jgi:hypothetical protein
MESVPGLGLWNRIVSDTSVEKAGETGLTENSRIFKDGRLSGRTIISELLRNMELGQFELTYSVLLPCIFSVYLSPDDHSRLTGIFRHIEDDARRALRERVAEMNAKPKAPGGWRSRKTSKEYKIAARDWMIEFLADGEVPSGDVEIHSELNETAQPGYRGIKTTLMDREPSVTSESNAAHHAETRRPMDRVFAEIRYEDESGPQVFLMVQNEIRAGRGGDDEPMDLALYTNEEISREHFLVRRDPATGVFLITDKSTNGTWLDGRRLKKGLEEVLPAQAEINAAEVITLNFQSRP